MSKYTLLYNNNMYYRRRIPKEFIQFFPQNYEIKLKMGKISQISGIMKAEKINTIFEELVMALQLDTFDKKEEIVSKYMNMMKNAFKESYYKDSNSFSTIELKHEQLNCEQSLKMSFSHINSSLIDIMLDQADIDIDSLTDDDYKQINKLYLRKKMDMLQEVINIIEPGSDFNNNNASLSPAPIKYTGITFKELYELFLKEKAIDCPHTTTTTYRDYDAAYKDFLFVFDGAEDRDIATFSKDEFREFINALHNHLPSSRTKKQKYKKLTYSKLKELELTDDEKMATNTKKKKISTIKQIFDIAVDTRYSYLVENYASPFLIKERKGRRSTAQKRKPLSD